ncbi:uncharacterized protein LOC135817022 [Sycon ciliatum]|uniref:uncharacterized protein LOC135817022 n=1 Tax=Sycon ciliatum TaxID=27933 RepID=UPI0031F6E752
MRSHGWGKKWRIRFEPTKSQLMTIAHQRHRWPIMDLTFGDHTVSELSEVKLLGITFDSGLSFKTHLHNTALKASSRLGFLRKAARVLDGAGKRTVYRGFVRPVLEYAPLVWMGAASSHLRLLDRVQRRALHILGPDVLLQSLAARRLVAGLSYIMYNLMCLAGPPQLTSLVPSQLPPRTFLRTRSDHSVCHESQLQNVLPASSPDYVRRCFPYSIIDEWNNLPPTVLQSPPRLTSLQSFKGKVHQHLRQSRWYWATDSL